MSFQEKCLVGFLLFMQAMFLGPTFGTLLPVTLITLGSFAIVVLRHHQAAPAVDSAARRGGLLAPLLLSLAILCIVASTGVWRLANQLGESINPIFVVIDVVAHSALFCSLLVWMVRFEHGHMSMLCLGLLLVMFCIAGGGASQSVAAQTTVALAACIGFALAAQAILGSAPDKSQPVVIPESSIDGRPPRMGMLFSLITLSILMMATSMISNGSSIVLPSIRDGLQKQLQSRFDSVGERLYIGGTRYVRGSNLGSIRNHMLGDPQAVALRIFSDCAPGYLRGHVFDFYRRGSWLSASRNIRNRPASVRDHTVEPSGTGTVKLEEPGAHRLRRFDLQPAGDDETIKLEIHNDPLKGTFVFLPLTTRWVEAKSNEIVLTHHGAVQHGVDPTSPYVAGVALTGVEESMDVDRRNALLRVPPELLAETTRVANKVCGSLSSTSDKIAAVSNYFQSEYEYSLTRTKPPKSVDPLVHFLRSRHDAHCEYFASASVLILRRVGVPTRYVTGYVADEFSDENPWWVARNSDAHAWAEAYDDDTRTWVPVESTPGRSYLTVARATEYDQAGGFFDAFGSDDGEENDSIIGRVIGWITSIRATEPMMVVFRIAQLPLFCVLAFLLWSRYLKPGEHLSDSVDQRSRRMLSKVDRRVRKYSLVRSPGETLYQFANRIDQLRARLTAADDAHERLAGFSLWYREYANARYRGQMPTPYA